MHHKIWRLWSLYTYHLSFKLQRLYLFLQYLHKILSKLIICLVKTIKKDIYFLIKLILIFLQTGKQIRLNLPK